VLGELLGRGGMAEVFAGHAVGDHGFQKPVAIKRLLPELANDEVFVDRLIEEAKLLVGMQHGNIVSVLDLAREGDDVFLVMEFVDGPSLRQLIRARGARGLSLGVASYIAQSAAAGLEFAHARPGGAIVHADISPSNLLLTTSGEVRVADFGIARREGFGQGVVEGKWAYMAPEQARGEPLAPPSDVFALGVVLYELLTGQHPFGAGVTADQRDAPIRVTPPRQVKPAVPHGLDAICMRALAHDPRDRYARMQPLIDALVEERFANGYREAASDLAQAIREVAPGAEIAAPRTMHTDRPVTLMTRSLLREVTSARRTRARAVEPVSEPAPAEPFSRLPPSGALTVARVVDPAPLDPAAVAQALLQLPGFLAGDRRAMPAFRLADSALPGDELASVVGGHTVSAGAGIAVEPRIQRWALAVLAAAALIGVGAAVAIQLTPGPRLDPAAAAELAVGKPRPSAHPAEPPLHSPTPLQASVPQAAGQASVPQAAGQASVPQAAGQASVPQAAGQASVPQAGSDPASQSAPPQIAPPVPGSEPASQSAPPQPAAQGPARPAQAAQGPALQALRSAPTAPAAAQDPTLSAALSPVAAPGAGDRGAPPHSPNPSPTTAARRSTGGAKAEGGVLSVQSSPWSWATIGNQKKETPDRFYLMPGTYVVKFYSPDTKVTKYEPITIEAGEVQKLSVRMLR
jgi:serine/threonine-protein kinase